MVDEFSSKRACLVAILGGQAEQLQSRHRDSLHGHQCGLTDRPLQNQGTRVIGNAPHHVEPSERPGYHERYTLPEQEATIGKNRGFRPLDSREIPQDRMCRFSRKPASRS